MPPEFIKQNLTQAREHIDEVIKSLVAEDWRVVQLLRASYLLKRVLEDKND